MYIYIYIHLYLTTSWLGLTSIYQVHYIVVGILNLYMSNTCYINVYNIAIYIWLGLGWACLTSIHTSWIHCCKNAEILHNYVKYVFRYKWENCSMYWHRINKSFEPWFTWRAMTRYLRLLHALQSKWNFQFLKVVRSGYWFDFTL